MDYDEAKKRFMLYLRCGQTELFGNDELAPSDAREYAALIAELGQPDADNYYEEMEAITDQLMGCLDPAPLWVLNEYQLPADATWHDVWRDRTTDYLVDHVPENYAAQLYKTYVRDLAILHPGEPASKPGFRNWMEAQTWDMRFMVDVLNQIIDDPVELPA